VRAVRRAIRPGAEEGGRPVGVAELEPDGHIGRVYVSAGHQRQGIGHQLLAAVVAEARRVGLTRPFTEASITARPFFESQGFPVASIPPFPSAAGHQARISCTTFPCTSVKRKSRPWNLVVSF